MEDLQGVLSGISWGFGSVCSFLAPKMTLQNLKQSLLTDLAERLQHDGHIGTCKDQELHMTGIPAFHWIRNGGKGNFLQQKVMST